MTSSDGFAEQFNGGLLAAMDMVDTEVTPEATATLNAYRGRRGHRYPGGILAFILTAGTAFITWRRGRRSGRSWTPNRCPSQRPRRA